MNIINATRLLVRAGGLLVALSSSAWAAPPKSPPSTGQTERGDEFIHPVLESVPNIVYPEQELESRTEGRVVLRITVTPEGAAIDPEIVESPGPAFEQSVLDRLSEFHFSPGQRGAVPVATRVLLPIEFTPPPIEPETGRYDVTQSAEDLASTLEPSTASLTNESQQEDEVQVYGRMSVAEQLEKSTDAVTVVRLDDAKRRSSDMGEVLSKTPGIIVRRSGGFGSDATFSINGLYGSAVRIFVDGVPLEMSGYPRNAANIPVNLIQHVEVYRGVVPLRIATDALGGAMNFATDRSFEPRASVSLLEGSFGTIRTTGLIQNRHVSNFVVRTTGYADRSRNDYWVDVQAPDDIGRLIETRVRLNNNEYKSWGVNLEAGVVEKSWAERLLVRGFYSSSSKNYGHNLVMSVPYGEVHDRNRVIGGQVLYEVRPTNNTRLEHITNLSERSVEFFDLAEQVYDWYGKAIRQRRVPGEIDSSSYDQIVWEKAVFSRTLFEWTPAEGHQLLFSVTPKLTTRTGEDRRPSTSDARDPLSARNNLLALISGIGYEWNAGRLTSSPSSGHISPSADYRVQNTISVKSYVYAIQAEEPLPAGVFRETNHQRITFGISDAMRLKISDDWSIKTSYEYATRLPDSGEVFGDGVLVLQNLKLEPEVSHNFNLGPVFETRKTKTGDWVAFVNGGVRDTNRMIVLLGNDRFYSYQNVYRAVTYFAETAVSWASPGRYLNLGGNLTANDTRNQSKSGIFKNYQGDRIPNRPPLNASWSARLSFSNVFLTGDRIEPFYQGSYTTGFFRGWESQGQRKYKQRIEEQLWHDVGITYLIPTRYTLISNTFEIQNLINDRLFEYYGQQRPGRAFYWKLVADVF